MVTVPRLLRQARARLAHAPALPDPWQASVFAHRVGEQRGRPIELVAKTMSHYASVATGLWIAREDHDVIVYDQSGTELHQDHIVCHELAHMLCGHSGVPVEQANQRSYRHGQAMARLGGDGIELDEHVRVAHRSAYDSRQEAEAEMLAYVIWQAAGLELVAAGPLGRAASAFEFH